MQAITSSQAGSPTKTNEDWISVDSGLIVVLDGATARTDTGCVHGVSWFAENLGSAIQENASSGSVPLVSALQRSILHVADLHPECDLKHPGSPSAAVGVVRIGESLEYLVLGDVSLVLNDGSEFIVVTDPRVSSTARAARDEADRHLIGSPKKQEALLKMKAGELAAKNREGGYWIATSEPSGVAHALTGSISLDRIREVALFTDGAARIVDLFEDLDWGHAFKYLRAGNPSELIRRTRKLEESDPLGARWPRNKKSDDASIVYGLL
ncbi:protein phosphatase 2C domain-containing protein [Streptomyces sp. NPDC056672]|uniref:protein phosphatase 2C domain-containing protein n=1 Tax=Streptomyces sp. NPDC056672 TaxID=3345906 RepID=UPI00367532BD